MSSQTTVVPQVGMLAAVRNRRALVTAVEPCDGPDGRLHFVRLDYLDFDGSGEDTVIWERELKAYIVEPRALPKVESNPPMDGRSFDALQRAARWSALTPFLDPHHPTMLAAATCASPLFGAVQVEDFQLEPLLKALQMPRIALLLADDVGLGKTVEAGLILTELIQRRRIRRVLILCPAVLRTQWQQEMHDKFALNFATVDRPETHALQRRLGLDANPWRTFSRIVASYHYLRQPDVLEQFRAACGPVENSVQLPWDLLIVDEAHNLTPANFGQDSDLAQMLRTIAPWFEHKLFLTATPHNGHARCFSGLLEQLDPVRFVQRSELDDHTRARIAQVVVRRLKREINQRDLEANRKPRFCERTLEPRPLYFGPREKALGRAFGEFRVAVKGAIAQRSRAEQFAGGFAIEVLNKRLLSCPSTFAQSWWRFREGVDHLDAAPVSEVQAAQRAVQADLDDDLEAEGRLGYAAGTVGAWFQALAPHLGAEIAAVDGALQALGLVAPAERDAPLPWPREDARYDRLLGLIKEALRDGTRWQPDERLVIFTEYKTTLDYLERRLRAEAFVGEGELRQLYGGLPDPEREAIKQAFNDPAAAVKLLLATDAASEGLNLQETAHRLLHYDIPWNPARLDQRNGRLDRHGQARDVTIYHFTSEDDADLAFLARVVRKVDQIREDLGSMGEVFDTAFQRRFADLDDADRTWADLDAATAARRDRAQIPQDRAAIAAHHEALAQFKAQLDLSPATLRDTLEVALGTGVGLPRFEEPDDRDRVRLVSPVPRSWQAAVDDHLRLNRPGEGLGPMPALVFDPEYFVEQRNDRPVFRAARDTALLHLGHPLYRQALATLARERFRTEETGGLAIASLWTVRYGSVPAGAEAVVVLTVEELATNDLRETFHHWTRTLRRAVVDDELGEVLPAVPAADDRPSAQPISASDIARAREIWDEVEREVRRWLRSIQQERQQTLKRLLAQQLKAATQEQQRRFQDRIGEVEAAMAQTSIQTLTAERDRLRAEMQQLSLLPSERQAQEAKLRDLETELELRQRRYQDLRNWLMQERDRVLGQLLPRRYECRGVQVFPVTVEIRLPLPPGLALPG